MTSKFIIRSYGRMELASIYSPNVTPNSAWRKFKNWIRINPDLHAHFMPHGELETNRSWTPREVRLLVEKLGLPNDYD